MQRIYFFLNIQCDTNTHTLTINEMKCLNQRNFATEIIFLKEV